MKHLVVSLLLALSASTGLAQPTADCSTPSGKAQAGPETQALVTSVKEAQRKREAALDVDTSAAAARAKWSSADKSKFFQTLIASKQFAEFEKQKQPLTNELMAMLQTAPSVDKAGAVDSCKYLSRLRRIVEQVKAVNDRQYDYMAQQIRQVK